MARRMIAPRAPFVRGQKRATEWIASADQGGFTVAANTSVILQSFTPTEQQTLIRTRGLLYVQPSIYTASIEVQGAFGICIVSAQAAAAGAASVPGPWTNASWDGWLVWQPFAFRVDLGAGQAAGVTMVGRVAGQDYVIDSKAMRKVELNEVVMLMCENQGGATIVFTPLRLLFKLV